MHHSWNRLIKNLNSFEIRIRKQVGSYGGKKYVYVATYFGRANVGWVGFHLSLCLPTRALTKAERVIPSHITGAT